MGPCRPTCEAAGPAGLRARAPERLGGPRGWRVHPDRGGTPARTGTRPTEAALGRAPVGYRPAELLAGPALARRLPGLHRPDPTGTFAPFHRAGVAQLDRASDYGSEGWGFEPSARTKTRSPRAAITRPVSWVRSWGRGGLGPPTDGGRLGARFARHAVGGRRPPEGTGGCPPLGRGAAERGFEPSRPYQERSPRAAITRPVSWVRTWARGGLGPPTDGGRLGARRAPRRRGPEAP